MDFHVNIDSNCKRLSKQLCDGTYRPSTPIRILLEKSNGLCRQIVIPAVDDALVLQCLSDELYKDIKSKSPTDKAFFEPDDHKFSNSKKDLNGAPKYGSFKAWLDFQKGILNFTKTYKYLIVTDIANFYDGISYIHLRNIMSSQIEVQESVLDTLIFILSGLLWQPDYAPHVEIGLPQIDIDASRILAHCFLYELDDFLGNHQKLDFVRYMDDIDIGVDSISSAKNILRDIDLILHTRQVRLNSGKTKILTSGEAEAHFRVRDNAFIDNFTELLGRRLAHKKPIERHVNQFAKSLASQFSKGRFNGGNGEKILKRSITLARNYNAALNHNMVADILIKKAGIRDNILSYITHRPLTMSKFKLINNYAKDDELVDDGAILNYATYLIEAHVNYHYMTEKTLNDLMLDISNKGFCGLYSAIWIGSKYQRPEAYYKFILSKVDYWRADVVLGRLVGGVASALLKTKEYPKFEKLVRSVKNNAAESVLEFHTKIASEKETLLKVKPIVSAVNKTKLLGLTHAKYLMLLGMFTNTHLSAPEKIKIIKSHERAWTDPFYRRGAFRTLPNDLRKHVKY
ncbi:hypothetical protein ACFZ8E_15865 [Methylobacterium sp. HMF5984]|uniref:RNA-directed DNA polymerase n=1 Tax=Methylobacterium sp. HMF5984 TaxID=3367370 RepID=UPI003854BB90